MEKKKAIKDFLVRYSLITVGCILYAVGVKLFIERMGLAAGGATGIALIISSLFKMNGISSWWIETGFLVFLINVPLLILGFVAFGKNFFFSTLYTIGLSSLLMNVLDKNLDVIPEFTQDTFIAAVTGGFIFGFGMGLIFRMGGSSGGTDIPIKILKRKFRHIKTGTISLSTDTFVVFCSLIVNQDFNRLFYTVISIVAFAAAFNWVLYGGNTAKTVYIITSNDKVEALRQKILVDLNTGATLIDAEGGYSKDAKRIILCVMKPFLLPSLRDTVNQIDKTAFMIVSSAQEIYGEGYTDPGKEEI